MRAGKTQWRRGLGKNGVSIQNIAGKFTRALAYTSMGLVIAGVIALATAGFWLTRTGEPLRKADAIVVLAGGFERSKYAADLFHQGVADKVLVSRPAHDRGIAELEELGFVLPREEEVHRRILLRRGVPASAIEVFGDGSMSTADEGRALKRLNDTARRNLVVVTSPAHARRAALILGDALGDDYHLQVVGTPYERFDPYWWRDQGSARIVILELAKLAYFLAGGRFLSKTE